MSTDLKPVTNFLVEVRDYLTASLPKSGKERARLYRAKKQASKAFTCCQECKTPLLSKWGTLKGTDDPNKALCTACKADNVARTLKRATAARRALIERARQFKSLSFDGRYEGPWCKSETRQHRAPRRDRPVYYDTYRLWTREIVNTRKGETAPSPTTPNSSNRGVFNSMLPPQSAKRFFASLNQPKGKTAADLGYEVSDSPEWLRSRRKQANPIKVYDYTPVPVVGTTLKRFGYIPQWPVYEHSKGWMMPHTHRDLLDFDRLDCFWEAPWGGRHIPDQGPDDFEPHDAFEAEDFEFDPDED